MFNCDVAPDNAGSVIYYESVRKVYLRPTAFFSSPKINSCWYTKDTAIGIHTLADAQIVIEFNWKRPQGSGELDPLLLKLHPDYINLDMGKTAISLKNPSTLIQKPEGVFVYNYALSVYAQARLPNGTDIAARRSGAPPARLNGAVIVR